MEGGEPSELFSGWVVAVAATLVLAGVPVIATGGSQSVLETATSDPSGEPVCEQGTPLASGGCGAWEARYRSDRFDLPSGIEVSGDGDKVYVTGIAPALFSSTASTVAYDAATGEENWVSRETGWLTVDAIHGDPASSLVVIAGLHTAPGLDGNAIALRAYSASDGAHVWTAFHEIPDGASANVVDLAMAPDNTLVYVAAQLDGLAVTAAHALADGAIAWDRGYSAAGAGLHQPVGLAISPDGSKVFVSGGVDGSTPFTIGYDAQTGTQLWQHPGTGGTVPAGMPSAVQLDPAGERLFVAGTSEPGTGASKIFVTAHDPADGTEQWRFTRGIDGEEAADLAVAPDGSRVHVVGLRSAESLTPAAPQPTSRPDAIVTLSLDASTGQLGWANVNEQGTSTAHSVSEPTPHIAVGPGGEVYVAGVAREVATNQDLTDYLTTALDPETGTIDWSVRYNGGTSESPTGLAVDQDGERLFVTGSSARPGQAGSGAGVTWDFATLAYDTAGPVYTPGVPALP